MVKMGTAREPAVVTAAEMVAGHVVLDISCLDRVYLNGYVNKLQTPGGVVYFFHDHRGKPIVSPALFEPIGEKFRKDMNAWAQANGIPVIRFKAGERKAEVMAPYLDAAAASGRSQVAAVGCAQEFQLVWTARKRATDPGACPQFSFTKEQRRVSVFYLYIFDEQMGPGFIKACSYFPYPVKVWVNGHEWAKRQAAAAGISFTALSNGFASASDPAGLQAICDRFGPGTVQVWFERWMSRIPLPLTDADRDAGYWWELSMRQVETSRTLVFDGDCHARAFFESLLRENMDLGRPENVDYPGHARPGVPVHRRHRAHQPGAGRSDPADPQRNRRAIRHADHRPGERRTAPAAMVCLAAAPPAPSQDLPLPAPGRPRSMIDNDLAERRAVNRPGRCNSPAASSRIASWPWPRASARRCD